MRPLLALVLGVLVTTAPVHAQGWTPAQEAEVDALVSEGGFYRTLQQVSRGQAAPATLQAWVNRLGEPSLVGTTIRDTLAALPPATTPWVVPLVQAAPAGSERDWVLDRRADPARVTGGKFHLSLVPVRMDLVPGVSMILPNYEWGVSYQDARQMTIQALEEGYSATIHLRWIDRADVSVLATTRLVQMYAGFRPRYIVTKPQAGAPAETDLVPLSEVEPQPREGEPGVLEQIQVGLPEAWQLYVGRTRWYPREHKVLVAMVSVHIERDRTLADRDRALAKVGLLLDTLRIDRLPN